MFSLRVTTPKFKDIMRRHRQQNYYFEPKASTGLNDGVSAHVRQTSYIQNHECSKPLQSVVLVYFSSQQHGYFNVIVFACKSLHRTSFQKKNWLRAHSHWFSFISPSWLESTRCRWGMQFGVFSFSFNSCVSTLIQSTGIWYEIDQHWSNLLAKWQKTTTTKNVNKRAMHRYKWDVKWRKYFRNHITQFTPLKLKAFI